MIAKILVVEDQFIEANNLVEILQNAGYAVCPIARSVPIALKIIENDKPDLVLVDIYLQGNLTGIDLAKYLREKGIAFVYISANSNRQILDLAKQTRPYGFLVKPFREKDVLVMLDIAWFLHQQHEEANERKKSSTAYGKADSREGLFKQIIGVSPSMTEVMDNISLVSHSETSVLILGESGTGKELVAHAIHRGSARQGRPFVVVNCGALPANLVESELFGHEKGAFTNALTRKEGKFELAEAGTIFLDEIGELPLEAQVKLLRVLQEHEIEPVGGRLKKINVRVIAATNRNLEEEIAASRFRLDLYYRLNVFPITIPPLRERKADILSLANHFLQLYCGREGKEIKGFSPEAIKLLLEYPWPGNVRELENLMARSVLLAKGPIIDSLLLPKDTRTKMANSDNAVKTMEENERDHIFQVLKKCSWKLHGPGGAAAMLNINESTLRSRMQKLGLKKKY
jgi:two-component system, NtrC family, response regulator HydG